MSTPEDRYFLKADLWSGFDWQTTDQSKGLPPPPVQKPFPEDAILIDLVPPDQFKLATLSLVEAIRRRRSRRHFTAAPLSLEELSFLVWATQGATRTGPGPEDVLWRGSALMRTVPSGGARHPFETYLIPQRVEGLEPGLYRFLPLQHKLVPVSTWKNTAPLAQAAWEERRMFTEAACIFAWTAIPYRTEWRYGQLAPKLIAQDSGHVCQNLYLACEAIEAGTCAVGAYNQKAVDALLGVDGEDEFAVYLAPVGKISAE